MGTVQKVNKKKLFFRILLCLVIIGLIVAIGMIAINQYVKSSVKDDILYRVEGDVSAAFSDWNSEEIQGFGADCILVLGAGIRDDETPTPMLRDRLDVGIELYNKGIAPKILLSGDNGRVGHNEIHVMLNYVKAAGIPEEDIFCDHAGFSTYDSLHRAESIFGASKVIVVTQEYHQYRALYIGKSLGIEAKGVASDQKRYGGQIHRDLRELLARNKDFFKVMSDAEPLLGGEAIPISGSGLISHGE